MKTTQEKYTELLINIKEMIDGIGFNPYSTHIDEFVKRNDVDDYEELSEWLIKKDIWDRQTDRECWQTIFG